MTPSNPHSLSSIVDTKSADMGARVDQYLSALQSNKLSHARFLNMLSCMEHIGSRKIMISQMRGALGLEVLKHLAEETRHAFFFKRHAERLAKRELFYTPDDATALYSAARYFGRLDAAAAKAARPEWGRDAGYYLVSLIIELRAGWIYHRYQDTLQNHNADFSLKSLIAEEAQHLRDMTVDVMRTTNSDMDTINHLIDVEDNLFRNLWNAVEADQIETRLAA